MDCGRSYRSVHVVAGVDGNRKFRFGAFDVASVSCQRILSLAVVGTFHVPSIVAGWLGGIRMVEMICAMITKISRSQISDSLKDTV